MGAPWSFVATRDARAHGWVATPSDAHTRAVLGDGPIPLPLTEEADAEAVVAFYREATVPGVVTIETLDRVRLVIP